MSENKQYNSIKLDTSTNDKALKNLWRVEVKTGNGHYIYIYVFYGENEEEVIRRFIWSKTSGSKAFGISTDDNVIKEKEEEYYKKLYRKAHPKTEDYCPYWYQELSISNYDFKNMKNGFFEIYYHLPSWEYD